MARNLDSGYAWDKLETSANTGNVDKRVFMIQFATLFITKHETVVGD